MLQCMPVLLHLGGCYNLAFRYTRHRGLALAAGSALGWVLKWALELVLGWALEWDFE